MNNQEIKQAARIIQQQITQFTQKRKVDLRAACQNYSLIHRLSDHDERVKKVIEILNKSFIPTQKLNLAAREKDLETINTIIPNIDKHTCGSISQLVSFRIPTLSMLENEIKSVQKDFINAHLDSNNIFSAQTKDITLEEINLRNFHIALPSTILINQGFIVKVIAINPNYALSDDYFHPHISKDGTLCTGDAGDLVNNAVREGRVYDFFCLVNNILNTYNERSPYLSIDAWRYLSCHNCETMTENISDCDGCSENTCDDCSNYCNFCENSICENCAMEECQKCRSLFCIDCVVEHSCNRHGYSEWICRDCRTFCHECGNNTCDNCESECHICGSVYCDSCVTSCLCKTTVCKKCSTSCSRCKCDTCDNCTQRCNCGEALCDVCSKRCQQCNTTICEICADEYYQGICNICQEE